MKSITKNDLNKLKEALDTIESKSAILNDKTFCIDDAHMDNVCLEMKDISTQTDINATSIIVEYLDSGVSETIEIDQRGRIWLDNNTNEYGNLYSDDCLDLYNAGKAIKQWWTTLPEK